MPTPEDLAGATEAPDEAVVIADAGVFAAFWNGLTPEHRERFFEALHANAQAALACLMQDHAGLLEALAESRARYGDLEARVRELHEARLVGDEEAALWELEEFLGLGR